MLGAVTEVMRRRGTEGWLVGGSVRDRELGRLSPDLDVAVADDAAEVAREVARVLKAPWFALSERHPTYRILGSGGYVDIAAVRGGGIDADLGLRDFTVNAMAMPLVGGHFVDPFEGMSHLRQKRLVAVSKTIFADDPLRLMRAPRFSHVLGFALEKGLVESIRGQAQRLREVAVERVVTEMALTLAAGRAAEVVRTWGDLRLLPVMLPEVATPERLHATLALIERLDDIIASFADSFPEAAGLLRERAARDVDGATGWTVALRMAGLMHRLNACEAETVSRRLKLSGALMSLLKTVSRCLQTGPADAERRPSRRTDVLFLWDASPWEPETILLLAATAAVPANTAASASTLNAGAARPADGSEGERVRRLMALWSERTLEGVPRPPLDGHTLMHELGLETGPLVGRALREVHLAWEAGEITTHTEAVAVARGVLGS